jgi:small subunit ribosomal protein S6
LLALSNSGCEMLRPASATGVRGRFALKAEAELRDYELVVVMNPDIAEEDVPSAVERIHSSISARGGEVTDERPWGRRRLAYAIGKHTEGNYLISQIRLDPARAHELETGFAISEDIIRHLLVRKDEA